MRAAPALLLVLAAATASAQSGGVVRALDDGSGEGPAYKFDPTELSVAPASMLRVMNDGRDVHTLTHDAAERAFHTGPIEPGTATGFRVPDEPGDYPFYCVFHGGMRGTLRVSTDLPPPTGEEDPGPSTPTTDPPADPPTTDTPLPVLLALAALALVALARRRG